jgi:hypothetical protein
MTFNTPIGALPVDQPPRIGGQDRRGNAGDTEPSTAVAEPREVPPPQTGLAIPDRDGLEQTRLKISVPLVPPKPKELLSAYRSSSRVPYSAQGVRVEVAGRTPGPAFRS